VTRGALRGDMFLLARTSVTIFSTRALNSSDSAAIPSGLSCCHAPRRPSPAELPPYEPSLPSRYFGCRYCARVTTVRSRRTAAPKMRGCRCVIYERDGREEAMSLRKFSSRLQCVFGFFPGRLPRERAQRICVFDYRFIWPAQFFVKHAEPR